MPKPEKSKAQRAAKKAIRMKYHRDSREWELRTPGVTDGLFFSFRDSAQYELEKLRAAFVAGYEAAKRGER